MTGEATRVSPFDLTAIPRISREEARVEADFARLRVDARTARAWVHDLRRQLERLQGSARTLPPEELLRVHQVDRASRLDDPLGTRSRVRVFLRLAGGDALLEFDLAATRAALARMLGVEADAFARSDLLTRLEEGALAYVIDLLATQSEVGRAVGPVTLRGIGLESAALPWPADRLLALCGDGALAEQRLGFRLLIARGALSPRAPRFDDLSLAFGAEIGRAQLSSSDFAGLEHGDIVLLEASTSRLVDEGVEGEAHFRARGFGAGPGFRGRWIDGGSRAELLDFHTVAAEPAKEVAMTNAASGEALLPDLPVRLRVEMGRVQMTLAELSALGVGAIVELHRDPKEPVGLWVEDRKIGAGELVSVDGQLGVRITELG